jgi:hypothetical protein
MIAQEPEENYKTGYIKIYRSLKNKGWYKKSEYLHLWIHILLKATHSGIEVFINGKNKILNPGQFITGRKKLSEETGINESKIERILNFFEKNEQQIEQQKSNKNRIITVISWDNYQYNEQQIEQQLNNKRTTTEQQLNTNNNDKNIKNDNNEKNKILLSQVDSSTLDQTEKKHYQVAISFWELIKSNLSELGINSPATEKAVFETWVKPIQLLIEKDKRTVEEFREIFIFLQQDEFWKEQIRSTAKLRKKNKEGITYFEVLLTKARNEQRKQKRTGENQSGVSEDYRRSILERLRNPKSSETVKEG